MELHKKVFKENTAIKMYNHIKSSVGWCDVEYLVEMYKEAYHISDVVFTNSLLQLINIGKVKIVKFSQAKNMNLTDFEDAYDAYDEYPLNDDDIILIFK